jgi:C-terminal processing protease CtpA/Prc
MVTIFFLSSCQSQSTEKKSELKSSSAERKASIVGVFNENAHLSIEKRLALFYKLKKQDPTGYDFQNEDALNMYGYSLLWADKPYEALEVFKLVVEEFPESSNAYDSLGEAYLATGNSELALVNYEKSLALNPDNFGAEDQIERIKYPDRKPPNPAELFVKTFSSEEYKADLDQLGETLEKIHPAVFKFISEEEFWANIERHKATVSDQTTFAEFSWMCSEVVASINCSHTTTGRFYPEFQMLPSHLRFPLQTRLVDKKLYVIDPLINDDQIEVRDEIISINHVSVSDLIQRIYPHISSQGEIETTKRVEFNQMSTGMIAYSLGFPEAYTIEVKGKDEPIRLQSVQTTNDPLRDPTIERCKEVLCLDFVDAKTAILTVASFNYYTFDNRIEVFRKFMDESFTEIQNKDIENLIVDVRFNGGGSPESAVNLLRYLSTEPFTYYSESGYAIEETQTEVKPFDKVFEGDIYFIIDGWGNSTTGHFMSMVKLLDLGVIVGEELGSNQFCTGGNQRCRLSNTKLNYDVANNNNRTTATQLPDEVGILPDYEVIQSIDEYLNGIDAVKEYALDLVNKSSE